ncbi:chromosome segregation protein [Virgibacillus halodenitrificans]|uniref:chromosome segregation protein n=1 Tax=Virgibacillus halodenitrificans TaxID=1482 RepID=UPI001371312D|nr:chromosome segregation protein [Virgibacillus halodenitrificans]MYL44403.1 chromosome segregation protein [Virgibacillus halodenitrificans]
MLKQVVMSEEEYEEIVKKLADYEEVKEQLNELENVRKEFDDFKNEVSKIFVRDSGEIIYRETGQYYSNYLFLNQSRLADLFNLFHKERFFKESGLTVDRYWKFN